MVVPTDAAVMILPEATLFPQALRHFYIYEAKHRRMLADALAGCRCFVVAMQKPGCAREVPSRVAGLGLIRVCVDNPDGTSHLILQGLQRVELLEAVRYKPYRVHKVRSLRPAGKPTAKINALVAQVRDLVGKRIALDIPKASPNAGESFQPSGPSIKKIMGCLKQIENAGEVADVVCHALLPEGAQQQRILETVDLEPRLLCLIDFLMSDICRHREGRKPRE